MIFFVATIALAVVVVVATKGSFSRLGRLHFRMLWLLFLGLAIQIVLEVVEFPKDRIDDLGIAILLLSYVAILAFCLVNRKVKGMTLIAVGVALNVLVIALNQGMPTKDDVAERERSRGARADRADGEAPAAGGRRPARVPRRRHHRARAARTSSSPSATS